MAGQSQGNHTGPGVCGLWWQPCGVAVGCAVLRDGLRGSSSQGKAEDMAAALGLFLGLAEPWGLCYTVRVT